MSNEDAIVQDILNELKAHSEFTDDDIEECHELLDNYYREISLADYHIHLDNLLVENFKVVSNKDVEFNGNDLLLLGENSSGKTSLLEALEFNLAGLPDKPNPKQRLQLTNLIQNQKSSANTETYWNIDGTDFLVQRILRRGGNKLVHYPRVVENPDAQGRHEDRRDNQSQVSDLIGITPLSERLAEDDFDLYRILSLFFLMSKDWRLFMDWDEASSMLDILFRVNLTNVINASRQRMDEEYSISTEAEESFGESYELENKRNALDSVKRELKQLEREHDRVRSVLVDRKEQLESVRRTLSEETDVSELQSRENSLESREANLERELTEKVNELARVNRLINRYEDTDLKEDLDVVGDEVRNLMSVPDQCPICTNSVDDDQRQRLLTNHECPLCSKEMPEDRLRVETEYELDESLTAIQEKQQERLSELQEEKDDLLFQINSVEDRLNQTREELDTVRDRIEEEDVSDLSEEEDKLEEEVRELEETLADLQGNIDNFEEELDTLEEDIDYLEELYEEYERNNRKRRMLSTFNRIVRNKRNEEQRKLQNDLSESMMDLVTYFNEGLFVDVEDIDFPERGEYSFEVHKNNGRVLKSSDPRDSTAEVVLHAVLFHIAVLKELSELDRNLPFRILVIDSPFTNEQDQGNHRDLERLMGELPDILKEYQVILSIADIGIDMTEFNQNYRVEYFEAE